MQYVEDALRRGHALMQGGSQGAKLAKRLCAGEHEGDGHAAGERLCGASSDERGSQGGDSGARCHHDCLPCACEGGARPQEGGVTCGHLPEMLGKGLGLLVGATELHEHGQALEVLEQERLHGHRPLADLSSGPGGEAAGKQGQGDPAEQKRRQGCQGELPALHRDRADGGCADAGTDHDRRAGAREEALKQLDIRGQEAHELTCPLALELGGGQAAHGAEHLRAQVGQGAEGLVVRGEPLAVARGASNEPARRDDDAEHAQGGHAACPGRSARHAADAQGDEGERPAGGYQPEHDGLEQGGQLRARHREQAGQGLERAASSRCIRVCPTPAISGILAGGGIPARASLCLCLLGRRRCRGRRPALARRLRDPRRVPARGTVGPCYQVADGAHLDCLEHELAHACRHVRREAEHLVGDGVRGDRLALYLHHLGAGLGLSRVGFQPALLCPEARVCPVGAHERRVRPALRDPPLLKHVDAVAPLQGREPVRDEDDGLGEGELGDQAEQVRLALRVDVRGRLVEDVDGRVVHKGAREGEALALAARQVGPTLGYGRVQASQRHDVLVEPAFVQRGPDLGVGGVGFCQQHVAANVPGKDMRVMGHIADQLVQGRGAYLASLYAPDAHASRVPLGPARQDAGER